MTIPLWTLIAAMILPYVWFAAGAPLRKAEFGSLDNNHPRLQEVKTTGRGARAIGAMSNAFEALGLWGPAVLLAHTQNPSSTVAPILAIVWVLVRVLHGVVYILDIPPVRTLLFAVGVICSICMVLVGGHIL
jgi:uncharacterized MAPEG superfamily protein